MENLHGKDFKNIKKVLDGGRIFKNNSIDKKIIKLFQKQHANDESILSKEYPNLNADDRSQILADYREYRELINAIEVFRDFPTNYAESNVNRFLTEDDIEDLKGAVEEMAYYVEIMEEEANE